MTKSILSQERLQYLTDYDRENGALIWKVRTSNRINVSDVVGSN